MCKTEDEFKAVSSLNQNMVGFEGDGFALKREVEYLYGAARVGFIIEPFAQFYQNGVRFIEGSSFLRRKDNVKYACCFIRLLAAMESFGNEPGFFLS